LLGWQNGQQGAKRVGGQRPLGSLAEVAQPLFLLI
jgi:hypothetical protein